VRRRAALRLARAPSSLGGTMWIVIIICGRRSGRSARPRSLAAWTGFHVPTRNRLIDVTTLRDRTFIIMSILQT
jgi:hypothetical protein